MDADLQALIDEASLAYAETERGRAGEKDRRHQPPLWDWRANREERRQQAGSSDGPDEARAGA